VTSSQTILIPLDGSIPSMQAIPFALTLTQDGGKIVLLRVVPEQRGFVPEDLEMGYGWFESADQIRASKLNDELREFARQLKKSSSFHGEIEARVTIGDPAESILDLATAHEVDFIVMANHGYGAVQRALAGSVSDRVTHYSTVPVFIVRSSEEFALFKPISINRLLLTLDGSELAEHSIPVAKTLARRLNIPINLVRALYMNYMVPPISEADDVLQELLAHDARLANEYLSTVSAKLMAEGIDVSITVEEGTPYEVVQSIAKPGDVVVLTSHGRSGIKRWLLGSVAEKLMRSSSVSVLLVPVTSGA